MNEKGSTLFFIPIARTWSLRAHKTLFTMKKQLFTVITATLTLASCATLEEYTTLDVITTLEYMESSARILEADHKMLVTPVIADLEVSNKKITYTEKEMFANLEVTQALLKNLSELKKIALSRAARANNADVLVGTTIDIVTNNERLEITVSGYPAHYVKFRKPETKDVDLLKYVYDIKTVDGAVIVSSPESPLTINKVEQVKH